MLKSIIEDNDLHTEAFDSEHASSVSILTHDDGHTDQMLRQQHWLIASDLRRHQASSAVGNNRDS